MLIKKPSDIKPSEITDQKHYKDRRKFIQAGLGLTGAAMVPGLWLPPAVQAAREKLAGVQKSQYSTKEKTTDYEDVTTYNNFYEFGTDKSDPAKYAHTLKTSPWTLTIEGEVAKPGKFHLEDIIKQSVLEERIYRFRCVEAWSMVIPWVGISLADIIKRFEPTSRAKFVEFTTLYDPKQMPGQKRRVLSWPYVEALRIDEAMNPLAIMAVGLYGEVLPNQSGAPMRLIVPWKYGFKNIKSIVKIRFTEKMPKTTWAAAGPREYGFYANVNPLVNHPRWSQARERVIGSGSIFTRRKKTIIYNGYGEQVAGLYSGMNLRKYF
ncbi:MAG: protein-methionine-sulfoxide reductase catalytic subunit MsrP [Gammaproteobacteria bacterium]|nr:protein-methionine-sulfoxide reductase catalytic subunit MsrP [Gammaproteobacteria bacterium]